MQPSHRKNYGFCFSYATITTQGLGDLLKSCNHHTIRMGDLLKSSNYYNTRIRVWLGDLLTSCNHHTTRMGDLLKSSNYYNTQIISSVKLRVCVELFLVYIQLKYFIVYDVILVSVCSRCWQHLLVAKIRTINEGKKTPSYVYLYLTLQYVSGVDFLR
jgi:hypothetical protein